MISVMFGRLNPPTIGHKRLAKELSNNADTALVYLSHSVGPKDPLIYEDKIEFATETFSEFDNLEVVTSNARQIFEVLHEVYNDYDDKDVTLFCGSDREDFYKKVCSYNGDEEKLKDNYFNFDSIDVKVLTRDEESDESSMSASKVRQYVAEDDRESFEKATDVVDKDLLWNLLKAGLQNNVKAKRTRKTEAIYNAEGQRLNNHGLHFEDCILNGARGIEELRGHIEDMTKVLNNEEGDFTNTAKIDGAPALVVYSNIEGLEGPGICLKSYMSENPKVITTDEEIDEKYGDRPDMAEKLHYGLELAKYIPENEAWQGDCLFSVSSLFDKDGDIAFQPNKIVYAVNPETETGKKIEKADFGIAFHTKYIGPEKKQSFKLNVSELKGVPSHLFVMDANVSHKSNEEISKAAVNKINKNLAELNNIISKLESDEAYESICENEVFMTTYFSTYQNKVTSDMACNYIDINNFIKDLLEHCQNKINKVFGNKTFKTQKGADNNKIKWAKTLDEVISFVKKNQDTLKLMVEAVNKAVDIKSIFMEATKEDGTAFRKYFRLADGYEETSDEGIALGDKNGNYVKIVNRSEFSHANRDPRYLSGFDHNNKTNEGLERQVKSLNKTLSKIKSLAEDVKLKDSGNNVKYLSGVVDNLIAGKELPIVYKKGKENDDNITDSGLTLKDFIGNGLSSEDDVIDWLSNLSLNAEGIAEFNKQLAGKTKSKTTDDGVIDVKLEYGNISKTAVKRSEGSTYPVSTSNQEAFYCLAIDLSLNGEDFDFTDLYSKNPEVKENAIEFIKSFSNGKMSETTLDKCLEVFTQKVNAGWCKAFNLAKDNFISKLQELGYNTSNLIPVHSEYNKDLFDDDLLKTYFNNAFGLGMRDLFNKADFIIGVEDSIKEFLQQYNEIAESDSDNIATEGLQLVDEYLYNFDSPVIGISAKKLGKDISLAYSEKSNQGDDLSFDILGDVANFLDMSVEEVKGSSVNSIKAAIKEKVMNYLEDKNSSYEETYKRLIFKDEDKSKKAAISSLPFYFTKGNSKEMFSIRTNGGLANKNGIIKDKSATIEFKNPKGNAQDGKAVLTAKKLLPNSMKGIMFNSLPLAEEGEDFIVATDERGMEVYCRTRTSSEWIADIAAAFLSGIISNDGEEITDNNDLFKSIYEITHGYSSGINEKDYCSYLKMY